MAKMSGLAKTCIVCGKDVSGVKRTKDAEGNYYCAPCWISASESRATDPLDALAAAAQAQNPPTRARSQSYTKQLGRRSNAAVASPTNNSDLFSCPMCGGYFVRAGMDASGVCTECSRPRPATILVPGRVPRPVQRQEAPIRRSKGATLQRNALVVIVAILVLTGAIAIYMQMSGPKPPAEAHGVVAQNGSKVQVPEPQVIAGAIEGDLWLKTSGGEVLSLSLEDVYLLPNQVPTTDTDFVECRKDLISSFHTKANSIRSTYGTMVDNPRIRDQELHRADLLERAALPLEQNGASRTILMSDMFDGDCVAIADSIQDVAEHNILFSTRSDPSLAFNYDHAWDGLIKKAVSQAETDRSGHFILQNVSVGQYMLVCRVWQKPSDAIVYWGKAIDVSSGGTVKLDLNNDNGHIMSY